MLDEKRFEDMLRADWKKPSFFERNPALIGAIAGVIAGEGLLLLWRLLSLP